MAEPHPPAPEPKAGGLNDLSDDALGFGLLELRTARDVVVRPRTVLEAWMTQGPTGGGHYARPLRLYLALNAILMLVLFLKGGTAMMLGGMPPEYLDPLIAASGKSRDAFMADADNWMSLVLVPLLSVFYALAATPLMRWWDPEKLGWRRGFRAAFAYLNALTVPLLPFSWWMYEVGLGQLIGGGAHPRWPACDRGCQRRALAREDLQRAVAAPSRPRRAHVYGVHPHARDGA